MVQDFKDDEPVATILQANSEQRPEDFVSAKIRARIINKRDAPLEMTDLRLIVELTGSQKTDQIRCGVDIVTVLDVSSSMAGKKIEKLKTSMKFLIKKLTSVDRLSIVSFSGHSRRRCRLTAMNDNAQDKVQTIIDQLIPEVGTDIAAGLKVALQVLGERRQTEGRTSAIMLMSDGQLSRRVANPSTVSTGAVPVFTFGLGRDHDSKVLEGIARRSNNGTYSIADVEGSDSASLNKAFSSCLAGLLSVVVEDLVLTITQLGTEIQEVRAGNYDQKKSPDSVTISFGNLYNQEKRKATVFLQLPRVPKWVTSEIVEIEYSFRPSGSKDSIGGPPINALVTRTISPVSIEPDEVINEIARGDTADAMKTAREQAERENYDGAKQTLKDAEKSLDELNRENDQLIKALKYEVQEFFRLLKNPDTYKKEGRAFALSSELSHGLQRFAARGDIDQLVGLAVPLAVLFVKQAQEFDKDPTKKVPTAADDKKIEEELINTLEKAVAPAKPANPIVQHADTLNIHLSQAIESLKAIQDLITALKST